MRKIRLFCTLFILLAAFAAGGYCAEEAVEKDAGTGPAVVGAERTVTEAVLEDIEVLSLEDCVVFALNNSFDVQVAKLDLRVAETDILYSQAVFDTIVFGSAGYDENKFQQASVFSPDDSQTNVYSAGISKKLITGTEIEAGYSDTRSWSNSSFVSKNPAHESVYRIEATQPVGKNFFGYVDRGNLTLTRLAVKNADLGTKDSIESSIADVETAYWSLVYARAVSDISEEMLKKARVLHESNQRNFDIGLVEKAELLASQANLIMRKTGVLLARNDYRSAEEELKLVMNLREEVLFVPGDRLEVQAPEAGLAANLEEAFEKRRDYAVGKRDVEIRKLDLKIKNNEKWPEIDLKASFAANGLDPKLEQAFRTMSSGENSEMYAGVEFSWPIENSAARSQAKRAAFEKEKAIVLLKKTERSIITEVGNAVRDVETYYTRAGNTAETACLQAEKLAEEEKRFRHGRSSTKNLIDYQQDLLNAEMDRARALLDLALARIALERTKNSMLEKYEEML